MKLLRLITLVVSRKSPPVRGAWIEIEIIDKVGES